MPADPSQHTAGQISGGAVVRRARPIYRVFVSSTWLDLQPERKALMDALNRMEEMRFVGMEFFGNRPDDTHDASIDQVDLCEVFVGIIGRRYGSGITAAEYRRARALNLPCFVYFKRGDATGPEQTDNDAALAAKLADFKQELLRGHTVKEFDRPEELAANATADLHNWVAARWISVEPEPAAVPVPPRAAPPDADRTNVLRLIERIDQDWIKGVLEASLHHRAWLDLGLDWRDDAVEHPWDRIVVAANRPIQTLSKQDSIAGVFDAAQHTLLVLGEPGAGKTTTVLELARDLIARARESATAPAPVVLALSTWRGQHKNLMDWLVAELGLRYQVPKRVARTWLEEGQLVLILDGLDEVVPDRRSACVDAINAFEQEHHPRGLAVTCRVAEYNALATKLRLRSAICLQPLTPAQIDRYFQAAGASLDPLRQALQDDAGLRDLARSPLMLSVMTMAWRDAPAETTAPFATAQSPQELRRRLFEAYVQAALQRRGKASSGYVPERVVGWLSWLARKMKEHGYTLFAVEHMQPGWLDGMWRQLGYFMASRLIGTVGLVLPFLVMARMPDAPAGKVLLTGLALGSGCYLGAIDFSFAWHGWGGARRAMLRLWLVLLGFMFLLLGWFGLSPGNDVDAMGGLYLFMVLLTFSAPVDVRSLDIKPAGSIQWSSRLATMRALGGLGVINLIINLAFVVALWTTWRDKGWPEAWLTMGGWPYLIALAGGAASAAAMWAWLRPAVTLENVFLAVTSVLICGEVGGAINTLSGAEQGFWRWEGVALVPWPAMLIGVLGGFGTTVIDPARPQRAGVWFWLRVPVMAFFTVGLIAWVPGLVLLALSLDTVRPNRLPEFLRVMSLFSAGAGLVAFLRFGGFNGAQHFLLRWLFVRGGHLPPRPDAFLNHAAQLALLQKVGLGYRFVHALLLEHLAAPAVERENPVPATATPAAGQRWSHLQVALRVVAWMGLALGLLLLSWMGAAALILDQAMSETTSRNVIALFLGVLMCSAALAIPILLLAGRWFGRLPWTCLAAGWAGLIIVGIWLAWDEPARPIPAYLGDIAVLPPDATRSYEILRRHENTRPRREQFGWNTLAFSYAPRSGKIWPEFITMRRAEIAANWATLAPVREWLEELNRFERLAILAEETTSVWFPPGVAYQVSRPLIYNSMAMASLAALDGKGDEAFAILLPLLEVGGKLEEAGARSGYFRNGREMQSAAVEAAGFVLDQTEVAPAARARFARALVARGGGEAGARRLHAGSFALMEQRGRSFGTVITTYDQGLLEPLRPVLDLVGVVVYNPQASLNRWNALYTDLSECAVRREPDRATRRMREFAAAESGLRFKNVGGAWAAWLARGSRNADMPAERQLAYWKTEDERMALLARLERP
jgi:DNA polymerase III delta prime subunit